MRRWQTLTLCSLLCACNTLLGIEDLELRPDAGTLTTAQREHDAGRAQEDDEPPPLTADKADAGVRSTREQPAAGGSKAAAKIDPPPTAAKPTTPPEKAKVPVTGTLIDYRMRKLPGVNVRIGDQQTLTDATGQFTLPDIPERYDITLHIQTMIGGGTVSLVWQYQGLSRRDPTLQVYRALPERDAEVRIRVDNVKFPLASDETVFVACSSPDGDYATDTDVPELDYLSPLWTGPAMSSGIAHALWLKKTGDVPSAYLGHATQSLVMEAGQKAMLTLDLAGPAVTSAAISGKVSGHVLGDRRNELYIRFAEDDTAVQVVDQWDATDSFSYMLPSISGSTATVVAKAVAAPGGTAAAYADATGGGAELQLELPPLPLLATPDDGKADVDHSTMFQWTTDAHVVVLCARAVDTYDAIYVVTGAQQAHLPVGASFGFSPPANAAFEWSVQTHDAYENIDAATSPQGFLSAYATGQIRAQRRGAGRFAQSTSRVFTSAP